MWQLLTEKSKSSRRVDWCVDSQSLRTSSIAYNSQYFGKSTATNQVHASSDECFQAFLSKVISWEPLPHTLVFSIFLSHSGPLQGSVAHLVPAPLSDLLLQPQKSLEQRDPHSLATARAVSFWCLGSLPSPARRIWWEWEKSRAGCFGMGARGKVMYGG